MEKGLTMPRENATSDDGEKVKLVKPSVEAAADEMGDKAAPNFLVKRAVQDESTSSISWFHLPKSEKQRRFLSEISIELTVDTNSDFMSPDLGKLCEKMLNL